MNRVFTSICALDALALAAPTRWLGPWIEFALALVLATVTAGLWTYIRFSDDGA